MIKISVPSTSANLGLGFDCLGLALQLPLELTILEPSSTWQIDHPYGSEVPHDERNLMVQAAKKINPQITPLHIKVESDIPLARGLGSSSSAIVAGLAMGLVASNQPVDYQKIFKVAAEIEGHPDNVAPAIFGGLQLTETSKEIFSSQSLLLPNALKAVTFIPNYELETKKARAALPAKIDFKVATTQVQNVANLVAAVLKGDLPKIKFLVEQDQFHEKYRADLAPEFKQIRQIAHQLNINGTYLSGAGPTVVTLCTETEAPQLINELKKQHLAGDLKLLDLDPHGLAIQK